MTPDLKISVRSNSTPRNTNQASMGASSSSRGLMDSSRGLSSSRGPDVPPPSVKITSAKVEDVSMDRAGATSRKESFADGRPVQSACDKPTSVDLSKFDRILCDILSKLEGMDSRLRHVESELSRSGCVDKGGTDARLDLLENRVRGLEERLKASEGSNDFFRPQLSQVDSSLYVLTMQTMSKASSGEVNVCRASCILTP